MLHKDKHIVVNTREPEGRPKLEIRNLLLLRSRPSVELSN